MTDDRTEFGLALEEGLKEALVWKRGERTLETLDIDSMPADSQKVAKPEKEFDRH